MYFAALAAFFCLGSSVEAATCTLDTVSFTLNDAVGAQCVLGNDLGKKGIAAKDLDFFGLTSWEVGASTDPTAGDGSIGAGFTGGGSSSGTWSVSSYAGLGPLMIVLKSGHKFGAFLLNDMVAALSGTWSITRERCSTKGCVTIGKNLSHASVYYAVVPSAVPLPAAGLMLLAGLTGLVALRRRRVTV